MRKLICSLNITLDGYIAGPNGELDFMIPDAEMNPAVTAELRSEVDTMLLGRHVYEAFEENFRRQAADPASPAELVDFATWMVETPKVVFSRSTPTLANPSARLAPGSLPDAVTELKRSAGGGLVLWGGVETVQQVVSAGLVDEYWLKVYPTALGSGQRAFPSRVALDLIESRSWASGITTLKYRSR